MKLCSVVVRTSEVELFLPFVQRKNLLIFYIEPRVVTRNYNDFRPFLRDFDAGRGHNTVLGLTKFTCLLDIRAGPSP